MAAHLQLRSKGFQDRAAATEPGPLLHGNRVPSIVHEVLGSSGEPLDPGTREVMESRFGNDFSWVPIRSSAPTGVQARLHVGAEHDQRERHADAVAERVTRPSVPRAQGRYSFAGVRVHADARAAESARLMNAQAFTVGQHIVFGSGQYSPLTAPGGRLLAHELAHVVQQREAGAVAIQRQAASTAPPAEATAARIQTLVGRFQTTRDADERLSIARQVLVEIDHLLADPTIDPQVREVLSREATTIRTQLGRAGRSPLAKAGAVGGTIVLVGGGPEDPVGDVAAAVAFIGVLVAAYAGSRTRVDPREVSEALDRVRELLRRPQRQRKPERPPRPLGPDIVPPQPQGPLHQGNIHVQGDDVPNPPNFAWSQPVPATKAQGLAGLALVRGQCTPRQLRDRDQAFARAERFIQTTLTVAPPPVFRTFQNPEVIRDPNKRTRRVDIEIIRGTAFA